MAEELKTKCVTLVGELEDWGKHILLLPIGFTLCGQPTTDASVEQFPQLKEPLFANMVNEYKEEEWDITCKRCLEMYDIMESGKEAKKAQQN